MTPSLGGVDLARLAVQLLALAAIVDAARRIVARVLPERIGGVERATAITVVAITLAVVLVQLLGFAGWLRASWLAAAVALVWLTSIGLGASPRSGEVGRERSDPWTYLPIVAAAAVLAPVALRAMLSVPTDWDGLSYHLLYPTRWLQEGRLVPSEFGPPHDQATLYPANGEALHAFAMAFVRSDLLVAPVMVALTGLFGVAVAALARALGAAVPAAAAAGALSATLPALVSRAASSYVEPLLDFAIAAAVLFAGRALVQPGRATALAGMAGAAAGLAAGTKYVGAPLAAALALALPLLLGLVRAGARRTLFASAAFLLASAATGGGWYLRNALLTGNPVFPVPFAGLPHLERPGLSWEGSSVAASWRELAADGTLGEALFALPHGSSAAMSLGPLALGALLVALFAAVRALARALGARRFGMPVRPDRTIAAIAWIILVVTYVALPFWDNPGLFRSLVRFAVPAAALSWALATLVLGADRRAARVVAGVGAAGVLLQGALAAVAPGAAATFPGLRLLAVPALAALLLAALARRIDGPARVLATAVAGAAALVALFAAWAYREAARETRWLDPAVPFRAFAEAALASERVRPGAATLAWASSGHHEFLAVFTGRRLERRVLGLPRHATEREGFRRLPGESAVVPVDPGFWAAEVARREVDLLVVSRWGAAGSLWPIEERWAEAAGWPRRVELPDFRIYEVRQAPRPQGRRGGPQPDSQPRAR